MSSANLTVGHFGVRSLINTNHSHGPSLVPCGAPMVTGRGSDMLLSIFTLHVRLIRKLLIKLISASLTSRLRSLSIRMFGSILSKAFDMSIMATEVWLVSRLSRAEHQWWNNLRRESVVLWFCRYANWLEFSLLSTAELSLLSMICCATLPMWCYNAIGLYSLVDLGLDDFWSRVIVRACRDLDNAETQAFCLQYLLLEHTNRQHTLCLPMLVGLHCG